MSAAHHSAFFAQQRAAFHATLVAKGLLVHRAKPNKGAALGEPSLRSFPSIADSDNRDSVAIANHLFEALGITKQAKALSAQAAGTAFENSCQDFLRVTFLALQHLRPGDWSVESLGARTRLGLAKFEQYAHLASIAKACKNDPELSAALGQDYLIAPDLIVVRRLEPDERINPAENKLVDETVARSASLRQINGGRPLLHASVSCKLTMRSDRAQNSRSEALNLIRTRKGRVPHIAVVTAEPLPSRLASLALGTGDIDCVYHIALPELRAAIDAVAGDDSREAIRIMMEGKRLRDIADLPLDLAI